MSSTTSDSDLAADRSFTPTPTTNTTPDPDIATPFPPAKTHSKTYGDEISPQPSNTPSITSLAGDDDTTTRKPLSTLLAFSALTLSIFLVALDTVLIPTALPTIALSFHIPDSLFAWTGSAYLLANGASVPFWAKLSDVFGRKAIILIANTVFLAGSVVCAVSVNAGMLVAGRAVQGLGGGGVVVLVHVCVADMFSMRDRSFYLGFVGAVWAVASALGPVLGGIFAQRLNWRWCFYINLPIVSFSTVLLYFTLNLHNPRMPLLAGLKSIDWLGTVTIITATLLLLTGLQTGGQSYFTHPLVLSFIIIGSLLYLAFPWTQHLSDKQNRSPIMPLRIFRDVSNMSALGVCACDALVFNSVAYFLPLYFQIVLFFQPSEAGLLMLAIAIPLALVSYVSGYIINYTGHYILVLRSGLAIMTLGVGLFISFTSTRDIGKLIAFLIVVGIGFGPNFSAPLIALQTRIKEDDIAAGTSAFGFVRMVSGAIGVVVGQVVFQALMKPHVDQFIDSGIDGALAHRLAGGNAISEFRAVGGLNNEQRGVVKGGMTSALRWTWAVYTIVAALGLLVSFGIKREGLSKEKPRSSVEEKRSSRIGDEA
ncbi:MFS general substrate transporter [Amniculicola lignicola CBS 123094]|uniref:MFS general substrate transporter n=1 Tax=Amniculicola lignicola CBS 123094 TaxID=1392246 RepID=A0A6A5X4X1_9PLEO|nr:MFS general substrate transporter [Amniculicola lignicola CBS 123094]